MSEQPQSNFPDVFSERLKNLFNEGFSLQYALETTCGEFNIKTDRVLIKIDKITTTFIADGADGKEGVVK